MVLGAGASYDSNPAVPTSIIHEHRPPLANALFDMTWQANRDAAEAFPRAAPALMAARADVKAGGTVEATLSRLQAEGETDPRARSQLMALRFYLQRVLTRVPDAWDSLGVRQTSYVSMLDQLPRSQRDTGQGLCLVTFNYDVLLERALEAVFGFQYADMEDYQRHDGVHLYKPHGPVSWARAVIRHSDRLRQDGDDARRAICDRPDVQPWQDEIQVRAAEARVIDPRPEGWALGWVPALAIPVEAKPDVVMPRAHRQSLRQDLAQATAVLCVGWRARERHFLRLLQDQLPSRPLPVWSVSVDQKSAAETISNLWQTGRFNRYRAVGDGFAAFADPEPLAGPRRDGEPSLGDVLRGTAPTASRAPGPGLAPDDGTPHLAASSRPPYASLG